MAVNAQHGSRYGYVAGCRCADCRGAQRLYQRAWREKQLYGDDGATPYRVASVQDASCITAAPEVFTEVSENPSTSNFTDLRKVIGPVESAVRLELDGLPEAAARPGLAAAALEMGRVLDHPRVITAKPAAARVLARLLDDLRKGGGRRGRLSMVRTMTKPDGA